MARRRRACHCSPRNCLLSAILIISVVTVLYELIIFCELDRLSYPDGARKHALQRHDTSLTREVNQIHANKVLQELSGFGQADLDESGTSPILNTVHYVWCGNSSFKFKHYLSVLSAWKVLQPDIIEFHEKEAAQTDKYNDWLDKIQKTIPSFVRKQLPKNWDGDDKGCGFWFGLAVLDDRGGIYIGSDVIVTDKFRHNRKLNYTVMLHRKSPENPYKVAAAMATDHIKDFRKFRRNFDGKNDINFNNVHKQCLTFKLGTNITGNECLVMEDGIHPVDLFQDTSESGGFFRKLVYGTSHVLSAKPALPGFIPKIVHYVWFGGKELSFMMYLSMLSTLFILNPQQVYIHTDGALFGQYFDKIKRDERVIIIKREKPFHIFGHDILYSQHRSDIVRAECLLKYGGIYMDWDVLWLRDPVDVISQGHDAIANFDHMAQTGFPDTINLGVLMAKPKSTFIKRWQDALINYRSKDFLYNAVLLPYKVYEEYPEYLHIEKRLQVMCFHLKCHPTFHPEYKSFMEEQDFDWTRDVYSIHYTYPDPPEFNSYQALMNGSGREADIGNFIMKHAEKLDKQAIDIGLYQI